MKFPMILTHRANPDAQIVVANAEQLAAAPADFLPPAVVAAAAAIPGVNLDVDTPDQAERRKSLDEAVDEFTAHVQAETAKLDAARVQFDKDRAEFNLAAAALDEQRQALARERAEFEAQRATTTSTSAGTGETAGDTGAASAAAEGVAIGDAAAAPAAPAKRTRAAKADAGTEGA